VLERFAKTGVADHMHKDVLPTPASVVIVEVPHGQSVTGEVVEPMWAFMAHWETGSGRAEDHEPWGQSSAHGARA
jgi:alanine-glyoxylate transaminase/serine-glyoxylate transaminase/serine-pyruvate transaminase